MSCDFPFKAFDTGFLTDSGKHDYILTYSGVGDLLDVERAKKPVNLAVCPYLVKDGHIYLKDPIDVPCGKCVGCRLQDAREWKIRLCLELQDHKEAYFLTLTYDDEHLPFSEDGDAVLNYRDIQLFMKRLRKCGDFRFFGCAEFGTITGRPHYHMILFGHLEGFELYSPGMFTCPLIDKLWRNGSVMIQEVCPGNIAYCSGYVMKKQVDKVFSENGKKEFRFMSRRPGIGMFYVSKHLDKIKSSFKVYGAFSDDVTRSSEIVPHAFRRRFDGEEWYEKLKEASKVAGEKMQDMAMCVYKCGSLDKLQFAQEAADYKKVMKLRKEIL